MYNDTVEKRTERERVGQSLTCTMILQRRGLKDGGLARLALGLEFV